MRILFLGDIVGKTGREAVVEQMRGLRAELALDFVVVNGENAAHGYGINPDMCQELQAAGVDCITTGNHVWDQKQLVAYADSDPRLLRPVNFPPDTPGRGWTLLPARDGRMVLVVNCQLRLFMEPSNDPFAAVLALLDRHPLGQPEGPAAILIDCHGEATAEKQALGHACDGRASLVVGTHTHVPTADARILPGGTAFQSDAGMCGDYDSVIGMDKVNSSARFQRRVPLDRPAPALGPATLCGLLVETDDRTGLARSVRMFRRGGALQAAQP